MILFWQKNNRKGSENKVFRFFFPIIFFPIGKNKISTNHSEMSSFLTFTRLIESSNLKNSLNS
jgi:hypothetical protein